MNGHAHEPTPLSDDFPLDLTRPAAPVEGQLAYESTVTAPTEWVPYVYTENEIQALARRRNLSVAAIVFGALGLVLAVFGVFGALFSLIAVVVSLVARTAERMAKSLWVYGFATGLIGLVIAIGWFIYISLGLPGLGG